MTSWSSMSVKVELTLAFDEDAIDPVKAPFDVREGVHHLIALGFEG